MTKEEAYYILDGYDLSDAIKESFWDDAFDDDIAGVRAIAPSMVKGQDRENLQNAFLSIDDSELIQYIEERYCVRVINRVSRCLESYGISSACSLLRN